MHKIKKTILVVLAFVTATLLLCLTRTYLHSTRSLGTFTRRDDARGPGSLVVGIQQLYTEFYNTAARQESPTSHTQQISNSSLDSSSTLTNHSVAHHSAISKPHSAAGKHVIPVTSNQPQRLIYNKEFILLQSRATEPGADESQTSTTVSSYDVQWNSHTSGSSRESTAAVSTTEVDTDTPSQENLLQTPSAPVSLLQKSSAEKPHCTIPPGGFKSWNKGVVTLLNPAIQRNCTKLFAGDQEEAQRTKNESKAWENSLSNREFLERTRNCSWLREELENNLYNTALEREFPMAYIFIINSRPQSVFRNLKLLFRPQNTFCFNFDSKTTTEFKEIFKNIDKCFDNVMISSKQENIMWGYFTIMEAQLNCHYDLIKLRDTQPLSKRWRYVINLCGKELPLMSPHEMVTRLSMLNGSSSIIPRKMTRRNVHDFERISKKVKMSWWYDKPVKTDEELGFIPMNLTFYKSSSYSILSAKFVRFLLTDPVALEVHYYFTKSMHSEEHFYATLFMMPRVPGGYDLRLKDLYVRAAHSTWVYTPDETICQGAIVNSICIITGGDLSMVMKTSENRTLFHNKYLMEKDHTAIDCLEEMIVERNKHEYERDCH